MKITIIANPVAGRGRAYRAVRRLIRHWPYSDWKYEFLTTRCPEHAGVLAQEQLSDPPDLLAVCGGDGTLHEVVSYVPEPPFPVALLPSGTANVLARDLGIPFNPVRALECGFQRNVRRVDLCNLSARGRHPFLLMAGVGLDAYVASKVRPRAKKWLGMSAFVFPILNALVTYPFPEFQVETKTEQFKATSCLVANAKGYGGGLLFTPSADMSDGQLDVLIMDGNSRLGYARFLLNAWLRRPATYPWIRLLRSAELKMTGPRGLWVHADGELIGTLPIEVSITPTAFPLVVPT